MTTLFTLPVLAILAGAAPAPRAAAAPGATVASATRDAPRAEHPGARPPSPASASFDAGAAPSCGCRDTTAPRTYADLAADPFVQQIWTAP
jgi:hypothetical protein